jgi:putative addiction module component (TIGR02574 family)
MILERFPGLLALSENEKLQLAEELYGRALQVLPHLSEDEIHAVLEESVEEFHRDPETGCGWEQVKARVLARRRA